MKEPVLEHQRAPPPPIRVIHPSVAAAGHLDEAHRLVESSPMAEDERVPWLPFSRRLANLHSFPVAAPVHRATYRSQNKGVMQRGYITNPNKSLNVLREFLQPQINREIQELMQKYVDKYFKPALGNIRQNSDNGTSTISDQYIQSVCQRILDESKKMFANNGNGLNSRSQSPVVCDRSKPGNERLDSDNENHHLKVPPTNSTNSKKRTQQQRAQSSHNGSNSDSEQESNHPPTHSTPQRGGPRKKKRKGATQNGGAGSASKSPKVNKMSHHPVKPPAINVLREGPRWNPDRLTADTKFVLGSKANKALGFGMTRGRLYTKHTDLFRYIGDAQDKQWLSENGLMPPAGGRAYLLVREDIEALINSPEYYGQSGVNASDMGEGFTVPDYMIEKMKEHMISLRHISQSSTLGLAEPAEVAETIESALDLSNDLNDNSKQPSSVESVRPDRPESGLCASSLEDLEIHSQELSAGASPFSPSNLATMSPLDTSALTGPNSH